MIEKPKCRIADLPDPHRKLIESILMELGRRGMFAEMTQMGCGAEKTLELAEELLNSGQFKFFLDGEDIILASHDETRGCYVSDGQVMG